MINKCIECGIQFESINKKQYCSNECKTAWAKANPRYEKICSYCGESFKTNKSKQKVCGRECQRYINGSSQRLGETEIIKRFEITFPHFEYISGYRNSESMIRIKCKKCGDILERCASVLRKGKELTCNNCIAIRVKLDREEFEKNREIRKIERSQIKIKSREEKRRLVVCSECGELFVTYHSKVKYCSAECREKNENRHKEINRSYRIKLNGKVDWDISLSKLIKKDKGICKICESKIDENDYVYNTEGYFIAGENYPSIDHVMPISKGGTHTWDNVQLAHRGCNCIKNDNLYYKTKEGQFKFVI